ncbi:MAG: GGDEF domain-containing protein [Lachnospiraceae bacterium]|nr:GGDEF domain-containing protein [Lachnospiraceae bacterium]
MLFGKKIIAVCLAGINEENNIEFISKINESLTQLDYRLMVFNICTDLNWNEENEDSEILVFDLIDYDTTDTIIILDEQIKDRHLVEKIIDKAKKKDIQIIVIDGHYAGCVNIEFDYKAGFEELVRHVMAEHSPKRLHFIAGYKGNYFSHERIEVFRNVIQEYGIEFDDSMVSYGDFWALPAVKAVQKLIDEENVPDAIICANDIMAINVVCVLQKNGYRVPQDVIVTGFDGIEEDHLTEPRITTCCCDYTKLADIAINSIKSEVMQQDYKVSSKLMISESCGCKYSSRLNILSSPEKLNGRFYKYQEDNRIMMQMAENIQNCISIEDVSEKLRNRVMGHTCVILNKWCQDSSKNPMDFSSEGLEDKMLVLFESEDSKSHEKHEFLIKNYVPDLEKKFELKSPVIFMELDYMNVPLGYVCFFYKVCDSIYFKKIPQIVSALNSGIGGWLNRRYQRYLTNQIERIYEHDALTGLYNRLGFGKRFDAMLEKQNVNTFTVVMADLDGLKFINDNYGHTSGDIAIKTVAHALQYACSDRALCVRFGGDEMLAVIEGVCEETVIRNNFKRYLDDYNSRCEVPFQVSASLGIMQADDKNINDFDSMFKVVDKLMYEDKKKKKAR